jgi:hypothetical protein
MIVIFESGIDNVIINQLSLEAVNYLRNHSTKSFILDNGKNLKKKIMRYYKQGVRQFVLAVLSSEILAIKETIAKLKDAQFVSPSSTLIELRGMLPNLYFTLPDDNYLMTVTVNPVSSCVVYDNYENPFVKEAVAILARGGKVKTFDVRNLEWQKYYELYLVSETTDIWSSIFNNLGSDKHDIYAIENYPPQNIIVPAQITAINICYPKSTVTSQINSTWNVISKNPDFSYSDCVTDSFPTLVNIKWGLLEKLFMISRSLTQNNKYLSRYLPLYNFNIKSNNRNCHITKCSNSCYAWLMDASYADESSLANAQYLLKTNPKLKKFKVVHDFRRAVKKYYKAGYRTFVLDAPSAQIKIVQGLKIKDAVFICTRATDPTLRVPGSNFLFAVCDDDTHIQDRGYAMKYLSNNNYYYILGTSDNVNIPLYRETLIKDDLKFLNIDELHQIGSETQVLLVVGNEDDFQQVFELVTKNRSQYPDLFLVLKNSALTTEEQQAGLDAVGLGRNVIDANYGSSEVFYDSEYAKLSRPPYVKITTYNFTFYLVNILFRLPLDFLYDFGLVIDI